MASIGSQIDKPQRGRPKRAELLDVNINTDAQSINTERASLTNGLAFQPLLRVNVDSESKNDNVTKRQLCTTSREGARELVRLIAVIARQLSCNCACGVLQSSEIYGKFGKFFLS